VNAFLKYLALALLMVAPARADGILYVGRLTIDGVPFTGTGHFKFALVNAQGTVIWSTAEMQGSVAGGVHSWRLGGDPATEGISYARLWTGTPPKLRVFFSKDGRDWAVAGLDVPLGVVKPGVPIAASLGVSRPGVSVAAGRGVSGPARNTGAASPQETEPAAISIAGSTSLGAADAPLVLVEFTDFQCPACTRFQNGVFGPLKQKYVDTGKVRVVTRQLPVPSHPYAGFAARAALCAQAQGRFWEMRERLFAVSGALSLPAIRSAGQLAGLDLGQMDACIGTRQTADTVRSGVQAANAAGILAPPAFILGRADGETVTGIRIPGTQPLAAFEAEIERQLGKAKRP